MDVALEGLILYSVAELEPRAGQQGKRLSHVVVVVVVVVVEFFIKTLSDAK